ncbi:MAG: hypothetical protein ACYDIA_02145 [Candidatus Humimicrobiaceae bacterium]
MTRFCREIANKIDGIKGSDINEKQLKIFTINFLQVMHNFKISSQICSNFDEITQEPLKNKDEIIRIAEETLKTIEEKSKSVPPKHGAWK